MINTAKAIAANGQVMVQFANIISDQCIDKRSDTHTPIMKTDMCTD